MSETGRKRTNFAPQGGGAHGAFTWGVLDHFAALGHRSTVDIQKKFL
jgi:predicted acylesterase/phospholipase RssA